MRKKRACGNAAGKKTVKRKWRQAVKTVERKDVGMDEKRTMRKKSAGNGDGGLLILS